MAFTIIQGGMGVGISGHRLARAVSTAGQLGVVSGTGLDVMLARRLWDGDRFGELRRALAAYPVPETAEAVLRRYYRTENSPPAPYPVVPMFTIEPPLELEALNVVANFVEVYLAKEGHDNPVGINYLTKIQLHTPSALYGAMLAGVDYVLMGAGIPAHMPRVLDDLAHDHRTAVPVSVEDSTVDHALRFDARRHGVDTALALRRPQFLAIVSAHTLAAFLARDPLTRPDGFVVEGPAAGGHNAPPRGRVDFDERGQPIYGPRDEPDLVKIRELGLPFWLAGGQADPPHLSAALAKGAAGIQVGTAFALCDESGLEASLKQRVMDKATAGELEVFTDPKASPSGYPFKVADVEGTLAEAELYGARRRRCDLGYLRTPYERPDGSIGYRCPSEPESHYTRKGGATADTEGRKCLCNALMANVGLGQTRRDGETELPLVTLGDDAMRLAQVYATARGRYSAADVIDHLISGVTTAPESQPNEVVAL